MKFWGFVPNTPFFGGQKYNVIEAKKLVADAEQEKSKVDYNNRSMYLFILNIFWIKINDTFQELIAMRFFFQSQNLISLPKLIKLSMSGLNYLFWREIEGLPCSLDNLRDVFNDHMAFVWEGNVKFNVNFIPCFFKVI